MGLGLAVTACGTTGDVGDPLSVEARAAAETEADMALAALAKGDYPVAERHVGHALAENARDPYALLAAGILYQNTDREVMAAQVYREIMTLRPEEQAAIGNWFRQKPRSITEIAEANLEILGMLPETAAIAGAPMMDSMVDPASAPVLVVPPSAAPGAPMTAMASTDMPMALAPASGQPESLTGMAAPPSTMATAAPMAPLGQVPTATGMDPGATNNIAARFVALRALLAEGLITNEEYGQRRAANLGALLPLTQLPPAVGLGRPSPRADEIVSRLKALGATLQRGAMTPEQHANERQAILTALLPASPAQRLPVMLPPATQADGAMAEERARSLKDMGVISEGEMKGELAAIAKAVKSAPMPMASTMPASSGGAPMARGGGGGNGVHLASYKSEAAAKVGWAELRAKFPQELAGLTPHVSRVDLGKKGVFLRLKAGPLGGGASPQALCARLKSAGQYCVPTTL
jgi:hypothetical protein